MEKLNEKDTESLSVLKNMAATFISRLRSNLVYAFEAERSQINVKALCVTGYFRCEIGVVSYFFFKDRTVLLFDKGAVDNKIFQSIIKEALELRRKCVFVFYQGESLPNKGTVTYKYLEFAAKGNAYLEEILKKFKPKEVK